MSTNVTSLWDFDSISVEDSEHAAVILFSKMIQNVNAGHSGMAGLVHRHGAHVQSKYSSVDIVNKKTAIKNEFLNTWTAEQAWIMSEEAGEWQLSKHQYRKMDAAVNKVANTIRFGGDLKTYDTASKCEKFNKEHNLKESADTAARVLREEGEAIAKEAGLEPGTDAFKEAVTAYIKDNTPDNVKGGKVSEPVLSSNQVFGQKVSAMLGELEKAGIDDKKFNDILQHIESFINNKLQGLVLEAASDSGMVDAAS